MILVKHACLYLLVECRCVALGLIVLVGGVEATSLSFHWYASITRGISKVLYSHELQNYQCLRVAQ